MEREEEWIGGGGEWGRREVGEGTRGQEGGETGRYVK